MLIFVKRTDASDIYVLYLSISVEKAWHTVADKQLMHAENLFMERSNVLCEMYDELRLKRSVEHMAPSYQDGWKATNIA